MRRSGPALMTETALTPEARFTAHARAAMTGGYDWRYYDPIVNLTQSGWDPSFDGVREIVASAYRRYLRSITGPASVDEGGWVSILDDTVGPPIIAETVDEFTRSTGWSVYQPADVTPVARPADGWPYG